MNYYTAHKNKMPRRISRRKTGYVSAMIPLIAMTSAMSAMQIAFTQHQALAVECRKSSMAFQAINGAMAVIKIMETEKLRRFKATGRYIK